LGPTKVNKIVIYIKIKLGQLALDWKAPHLMEVIHEHKIKALELGNL
jgi:hypothetical protein